MTLLKKKVSLTSAGPYNNEILTFLKKNPKFMRSVCYSSKEFSDDLTSRFFRKLKTSKFLSKLNLNLLKSQNSKNKTALSIYKNQGKTLREANTRIARKPLDFYFPGYFTDLKRIQRISLLDSFINIHLISALPLGQELSLQLVYNAEHLKNFSKWIARYNNINILKLMLSTSQISSSFDTVTQALDDIASKCKELEIFIQNDVDSHHLENFIKSLNPKVKKFRFTNPISLNGTSTVLSQVQTLQNLKSLYLTTNNISFGSLVNLRSLERLNFLETLALIFPFKNDPQNVFQFMESIRLPPSLLGFQLKMGLLLTPLIRKHRALMEQFERNENVEENLNLFQDEESIASFLDSISEAKNLKNIDLEFCIGELFVSPFTHFFVSIVKRVLNAETIKISIFEKDIVIDPESKAEENGENCFNLALFFDFCPNLQKLELFHLSVPNYYFGFCNLAGKFPRLHSIKFGTQETLFFERISVQIERILKSFSNYDIQELEFEFTETLTSKSLAKRFASLKKFKNLRYFSSRFKITQVESKAMREVGDSLQKLKSLNFLYLAFENFENDFKGLENYIKYHHSIKDVHVCFIKK